LTTEGGGCLAFSRVTYLPLLITAISGVLPGLHCNSKSLSPVSLRLPTAGTWVRARVKPCGICGGKSGTEAGFLRVYKFPLSITQFQ
jgi:hypothetical protein